MVKEYIFGVLLLLSVVILAMVSGALVPGLDVITGAIIIGLLTGNLTGLPEKWRRGVQFCEKVLLNLAIILMGLELQLSAVADIGSAALIIILGVVSSSLLIGWIISRYGLLPPRLSFLLGVGNGICGSAAIVSCSPIIGADREELGISIAVINLLGAAAIALLPLSAGFFHLDQRASALLIGGTIQAVGQTVAAALVIGEDVAGLAVLVKMGRVMMLGVVVIVLSGIGKERLFDSKPVFVHGQAVQGAKGGAVGKTRMVPPFITGFLIAALLVNLFPIPVRVLALFDIVKRWMLYLAMAAVGTGIRFSALRRFGPVAFLVGTGIFMVNLLLTGLLIAVLL